MALTRRAITIGALLCLRLAGGTFARAADPIELDDKPATKPATTKPSTTQATSKPAASTRPVNETVVVDLGAEWGPFVPRARGQLRPPGAPAPGQPPRVPLTRPMLAPLGPLAEGRGATEPPVLVTLADAVKYDGTFPGQKSNWAKWDQGVEALVRKHLAEGRPVVYEVCREPDDKAAFKGDRTDFFSVYVRTVRIVRSLAPKAVIAGPSVAKHDGLWIQEFLKVAKEYGVLPDVVSWHEDGLKHDLAGHVGNVGETFWQDGATVPRVAISAGAAVDAKYHAGDPAIFMAQMEKSQKENAWRPAAVEFAFKLTHLFADDGRPRSVFYTWREYAALANAGRAMKVSSAPTVDGVAVWDAAQRTCRALVGRNRSRVDAKHVLGTVTLQVKGAKGATAHVRGVRIADSGAKPSDGPAAPWDFDIPIKNGELSISLGDIAPGDAYSIEVNVRGEPPAAPATPPAAKPKPAAPPVVKAPQPEQK